MSQDSTSRNVPAAAEASDGESAAACTIFHDGDCPLCRREIAFMRRRDRAGRLEFIDITDPDFDPSVYGLDHDSVMREIHGLDEQRRVIRGTALFRRAYREIGLGALWAWTGWPVLRPICNFAYRCFARIRVPLGRLLGRT